MRSVSRIGFGPVIDPSCNSGHSMGGISAYSSPGCANCQEPFTRFFSIDLREATLGLSHWPSPTLELLFCWQCGVAQEPFFYQVRTTESREVRIVVIDFAKGVKEADFPYPGYPRIFPQVSIRLEPIEDLRRKKSSNGDHDSGLPARHQFGGKPVLFQDMETHCALCQKRMHFLANESSGSTGFVGAECVQVVFTVCKRCAVICARNETD